MLTTATFHPSAKLAPSPLQSLIPAGPQHTSFTLQVLPGFFPALDSEFWGLTLNPPPHILQPTYLVVCVPSSVVFS